MRYYTAIVHQEGDSAFGLTFPDLTGGFASADDWDTIPAAENEALDLWFENMRSAAPASLSEARAQPEVAEALRAGA
ncbi:type II toxin-antitoxin system HicB family antitoxin [Nioella sp.]|uniref:type II toxin-antitoxin system HicB family antitoxin n=1 Tax=Nioella sp. TaxID=1912091 RepID=UPI003518F67F